MKPHFEIEQLRDLCAYRSRVTLECKKALKVAERLEQDACDQLDALLRRPPLTEKEHNAFAGGRW